MNLAQAVPTLENEPAGLWLPLHRYLGALAFVGVAFLIRYWLSPVLGEELPFMFFIAASLVAAWRAGAAAGISALLLGLFLADYFFVRGHHPENWRNPMMALLIVRYLFTASLGIALIEFQHRARRRTEKA